MNLLSVFIQNIRKITLATVQLPTSGVVQVTGPNESGKSTFLKSIVWGLRGKTAIDNPDHVITEGEKKGKVVLTVGSANGMPEYDIDLRFRKGGPVLKVTKADGGVLPDNMTQSQLLKRFWNDVSIDPLKFAQESPAKQREVLLKVVKFQTDDEYKRIVSGVDPVDGGENINPLEMLDIAYKMAYESRRDIGRDVKQTQAQLAQYADVDDSAEPIDTEALRAQLRTMRAHREQRNALTSSMAVNTNRIITINQQIAALEQEKAQLESQNATLTSELDNVPQVHDVELANLEDKLAKAGDAERIKAKKNLMRKLQLDSAEHDRLDTLIQDIRDYKTKLIETAEMPIPGLGFDEETGGVTYEGEPLEARGVSRNLKVGAAIAAALSPELKIVLIDQGSEIDDSGILELAQWAKEHDILVIMAREKGVDGDGTVSFTIEDGEVH